MCSTAPTATASSGRTSSARWRAPPAVTQAVGDGLPGASGEDADARRRAREERAPAPRIDDAMSRPPATPSSSSRRPASAGGFPIGTPVLQAARTLGVDIDSVCGGRAICGRCQITVGEGEFAKHGIVSTRSIISRHSPPSSSAMTTSAACSPAAASPARPSSSAMSSSTCRPKARSTSRSCASAPRRAPSRSIRSTRLHYHRSGGARHAQALLRSRARLSRARGAMG